MALMVCNKALAIPTAFLQQMPPGPVGAIDDAEDSDENVPGGLGMAEPDLDHKMPKANSPTSRASMNAAKRPDKDFVLATNLVADPVSQQPKSSFRAPGDMFFKSEADTSSSANQKAMQGGG